MKKVFGRASSATAAALLVGVAACSSAAALPAVGAVALVDRRSPFGYSAGSTGTATAVSQPASAAESAGVVLIDTVLPYQNAQAAGTGMVLTSTGQVLTNYHVVSGAGQITVTIAATGQSYQATVVGSDATDDVALLQLDGASNLTTVKMDDDTVNVGDTVTAVGNAGGTGSLSTAAGTVSSLTASVTAAAEGAASSETLSSMIETTADVVAGDSGGPLYDAEGEVIGIDTAASTGAVIDGYAIPIQQALSIVNEIRSGTDTSTVRVGPAPFLGVALSSGQVGLGYGYARGAAYGASGAVVGSVVTGSAAASAGLSAGDVITSLNGKTVTSSSDVTAALATAKPGDSVTLSWTDAAGATRTATVSLGASPVA